MFKAKNPDVIDLEKYKAVKKPDSAFKIEKVDGHDVLILDSDEEIENNVKAPPSRNIKPSTSAEIKNKPKKWLTCLKNIENKLPITSAVKNKLFRQQKIEDTFKLDKQPQKKIDEKWEEVKRRLRSPSFKKTAVKDALLAYANNGSKRRGRAFNRCSTPENTHIIKSHPYFKEDVQAKEMEKAENGMMLSKHGYPLTPPRYWEIEYPSIDEQKELGLLNETDSPLFKKRKD